MENQKNTVTIDIETYNELRDIKKAVDERKKIFLNYGIVGNKPADYFCAEEEDLNNLLVEEALKLRDKIHKLSNEIYYLKYPDKVEPDIDQIKQMNLWELIKWKYRKFDY